MEVDNPLLVEESYLPFGATPSTSMIVSGSVWVRHHYKLINLPVLWVTGGWRC